MVEQEPPKKPSESENLQTLIRSVAIAASGMESQLKMLATLGGQFRPENAINSMAGAQYTRAVALARMAATDEPDVSIQAAAIAQLDKLDRDFTALLGMYSKKDIKIGDVTTYPSEIVSVISGLDNLEKNIGRIDPTDPFLGAASAFEYLSELSQQLDTAFPYLRTTIIDEDQRRVQQVVQTLITPRVDALRVRLGQRAREVFSLNNPDLKTLETGIRSLNNRDWMTTVQNLQNLAQLLSRLENPATLATAVRGFSKFENYGAQEIVKDLIVLAQQTLDRTQQSLSDMWMNRILLASGPEAVPAFANVNTLLSLPSPSPEKAEERKNVLTQAETSIWSGSDVVVQIPEIVVGGKVLFPPTDLKNTYRDYVRGSLLVLIAKKKDEIDRMLMPESVALWSVNDIVTQLEKIWTPDSAMLKALYGAFHEKVGNEQDPLLQSLYKDRVALHLLGVYGDARATDFSVRFSKIIEIVGDKSEFIDYCRALFLTPPKDAVGMSGDELDALPVDGEALELVEYIIARIKGDGKVKVNGRDYLIGRGGKDAFSSSSRDPKEDFTYGSLVNQRVKEFKIHLHTHFGTHRNFATLVDFSQYFGAKTAGYVPHLLRGATRGHGGIAAERKEYQKFEEELMVMAPIAVAEYGMTRYKNVEPLSNSWLISFVDEDLATKVVYDADVTTDLVRGEHKSHRMGQLWELMDSYYHADLGIPTEQPLPGWLEKVRANTHLCDYDDENKDWVLDLNSTFFPTPVELITQVMKVDQKKKSFGAMPVKPEPETSVAMGAWVLQMERWFGSMDKDELYDWLGKLYSLGYIDFKLAEMPRTNDDWKALAKNWKKIGINLFSSGKLTFDQYTTAFEAMKKMFELSDEAPQLRDAEHTKAALSEWLDKGIGKAKLVPGKHWLLMRPLTLRYMKQLMNRFSDRKDIVSCEKLILEMCEEIENANGLPKQLNESVKRDIPNKNNPPNWLFEQLHPFLENKYLAELWEWKYGESSKFPPDVVLRNILRSEVAASLLGGSLVTGEGEALAFVPPWHHAPAAKKDSTAGDK